MMSQFPPVPPPDDTTETPASAIVAVPLLSKLQLRSEIMAVVDVLTRQDLVQRNERERQVKRLTDLPNRRDVLNILIRELNRAPSGRPMQVVGELLVELGTIDTLQEPLWQLIEQPAIRDETKDVANLVLRHLGDEADPELYLDYLEDPEGLITRETARMLETSLANPEALVDFIDFIFSLDEPEQLDLLASLHDDYSAQQLTGLLVPLLGAQPSFPVRLQALKVLGDSESPDALAFLQHYVRYLPSPSVPAPEPPATTPPPRSVSSSSPPLSPAQRLRLEQEHQEERKLAQKALNRLTLRLKTPVPSPPATSKAVNSAPDAWIAATPIYQCYATIPDGVGNQGLLLSRQWANGDVMMICTVINDHHGVMDCFGFHQMTVEEFDRLIQKFYEENSRVPVNASYIAQRLAEAEALNWQTYTRIPYEFLCWRVLVQPGNPVHQAEGLKRQAVVKKLVAKPLAIMTASLYQHPDFDSWFLERDDWPQANPILDEVAAGLSQSPDPVVVMAWLNARVLGLAQAMMAGQWGQLLQQRLWQCAYLLHCQQTPTFAKLAATEAYWLSQQPPLTDLEPLKGRFLLSYARRCIKEELLRLSLEAKKPMAEAAQRTLSFILPLWAEQA
jgi:hypothetical protein